MNKMYLGQQPVLLDFSLYEIASMNPGKVSNKTE